MCALQTKNRKRTLIPERRAIHAGYSIDDDEHKDPFNRSRENTKKQLTRMVLFPSRKVEAGEREYLGGDRPPGASKVERIAS